MNALLWHGTASSVVDLSSYLAPLNLSTDSSVAYGIAENGVIVGFATNLNKMYAVMWTPVEVPEPTSLLLGAVSLGFASVMRVRRF